MVAAEMGVVATAQVWRAAAANDGMRRRLAQAAICGLRQKAGLPTGGIPDRRNGGATPHLGE